MTAHESVVLVADTGEIGVTGLSFTIGNEPIGTAAIISNQPGVGELRWDPKDFMSADGTLVTSLRLAVDYAFKDLGLRRIEAFIDLDDTSGIRVASMAGLRREGVMRQRGEAGDQVLLARVDVDPDALTPEGFIGILNSGLPKKRVIAQGVLRDAGNRVLLCELTYKKEWDLPGGVIETGESPAIGLVREIEEELGIEVKINSLLTVNWLPPWKGWDDAVVFVFDLGVAEANLVEKLVLQETEIKGTHWCDQETIKSKATAATIELLSAISNPALPNYREAPEQPVS